MKVLFFGAGPVGSVYAHRLHQSGIDVTLLARGDRYAWLAENGLALVDEIGGLRESSRVSLADQLRTDDHYDLIVVCVRKNRLAPVFETLAANRSPTILFMGNNALGFDAYLEHLPAERMLMGFPGAGGGLQDHVVHYADREQTGSKRRSITIGEMDGRTRDRTRAICSLFENAGVPVDLTTDIDGWLRYHVALISPLVGALYKHGCDPRAAAQDRGTLREMLGAAKEGGRVLAALGFRKRQPFAFNLFYWLPEVLNLMAVRGLLESRFAEIAFAMHARAARDEMQALAGEFEQLARMTSVPTPNIDALRSYLA